MKRWGRYDLAVPIGLLSLVWLSYFKYPFSSNLFISILATGIVGFEVSKAICKKTLLPDSIPLKPMDAVRRIVFAFALFLFLIFIGTSTMLGGNAVSDEVARLSYEGYTAGTYYLATRTTLTAVSQETWIFMRVFESITIPLMIVSFLGNVLYIGFTKGWKSVFRPY